MFRRVLFTTWLFLLHLAGGSLRCSRVRVFAGASWCLPGPAKRGRGFSRHRHGCGDERYFPAPPGGTGEATNAAPAAGTSDAAPQETGAGASASTPVTRYHFHINEKFAGPDAADIDVFSGGDDGDCGFRFKQGEQYIVFTQQEVEGHLFATICNGTRVAGRWPRADSAAPRDAQRTARRFRLRRAAAHRTRPFWLRPTIPTTRFRISRSSCARATIASPPARGPGGIYTFYDVHAGEYNFTANLPVRMVLTQKTLTGGLPPFKIPNGACYEYDVDALPTGHIRGSVLGPDGKPLKLASVELYRAGQYSDTRPGLWGFQGSKGYFDFDHIGPGEYVMVYNRMNRMDPNSPFPRSFYPGASDAGDAEPIRLKDGQQLLKANIKLRDGYPTRPLRVHVKWEHGRPPGNLTVMAKARTEPRIPPRRKSADGLFEFTLLQSGHYTVSAWEDLDPQRAPAGHGSACTVPARIDAGPVEIDASNPDAKEVSLTFPRL